MPETITTTVIGVRRRRQSVSYTYPDDGRDYGDSYYTEYDHDGNETGRRARRDSLGHPGRAPSPPPRPSTTDPSLGQSYAIRDEPAGGAPRHITAGSSAPPVREPPRLPRAVRPRDGEAPALVQLLRRVKSAIAQPPPHVFAARLPHAVPQVVGVAPLA
ncbi:hypothetical protein EKO27_g11555 [Xylaria grammica]|uniref:Uncharacterized protein n=1 Tax=Xylaria grammica TaxID=363999 RepID=A0A439CMZ9_9PEZI|nr:hypothetical protein EKO27_g11555 [Xylaria grammica]